MAITRKVDGIEVELSPGEAGQLTAERARQAAEQAGRPRHAFEFGRGQEAVIRWIASLHGLSYTEARAQLDAIWDGLA